MAEIKMTSKKEYAIVIPNDLDLDTVNKIEVRGREFVEVIRCKDCRYWSGEYCPDFMTTDDSGFCCWGERREE